jgi:hypothetical protein
LSDTTHGTCGISTNGELFCGGTTGANYAFGNNYIPSFRSLQKGSNLTNNIMEYLSKKALCIME